ncbi:hypothetical protein BCR34DRAFT_565329 [Clohesyomyces aquaticus]|uniref:Uncharacterized protein n=1 Tax=Clohesyomyces aquaticus TaxID=1231657 RepID=A0A1Y1ZME3_9PLEO|nr:hypothetical protein BCR34DRAFT_565329 [Clohesyomyces aquaticus]
MEKQLQELNQTTTISLVALVFLLSVTLYIYNKIHLLRRLYPISRSGGEMALICLLWLFWIQICMIWIAIKRQERLVAELVALVKK